MNRYVKNVAIKIDLIIAHYNCDSMQRDQFKEGFRWNIV